MNYVALVREFASIVAGQRVVIARNGTEWGCNMSDQKVRITCPKDFFAINEMDRLFRKDFINRCPLARGFSHVTISILHEIGHEFNREAYIFCDSDIYNNAHGVDHFKLPCEMIATDWAIQWLQDAEHRKQAKAFERKFFGYGTH